MRSYCDADCENCGYGKDQGCKGCMASEGCPFGKKCFIAQYIKTGGKAAYDSFVRGLIGEINALNIPGLPEITELFPLSGGCVNLAYPMPSGESVKLLDDAALYLGNQVECEFAAGEDDKCFGIVADMSFILIARYGENGSDPELIAYVKR